MSKRNNRAARARKIRQAARLRKEKAELAAIGPQPTGIRGWASKPMNAKLMPAAIMLLFAVSYIYLQLCSMRQCDYDTYYMISEGRRILSEGFTGTNPYLFFDDYYLPLQQWLYCVLLALFDGLDPSMIGITVFSAIQGMLLFWLIHRFVYAYSKDRFWSYLAAILATALVNFGYFFTSRPENITLILLMIDMLALDRYKKTGKAGYLYILPVCVLAEMNLHASMWPFHFCVLLANAFPCIFKNSLDDNQVKPTKHLFIAIALMIGALFLNPYGTENILYVFRSLNTFTHVQIFEQQPVQMLSWNGIMACVTMIIAAVAWSRKLLRSTSAYAIIGFCFLGATSHHSAMFMPLAVAYLASDLAKKLHEKAEGRKAADTMPNGLWITVPLMALCLAAGVRQLVKEDRLHAYYHNDELDSIVAYIDANDPDHESAILNFNDTGSYLEYNGFKNIFADTRPEALNMAINKKENSMELMDILDYGLDTKAYGYADIDDIVEEYDIRYILVPYDKSGWTRLRAYLDYTDKFELPDLTKYGHSKNAELKELNQMVEDGKLEKGTSSPDYLLYERKA